MISSIVALALLATTLCFVLHEHNKSLEKQLSAHKKRADDAEYTLHLARLTSAKINRLREQQRKETTHVKNTDLSQRDDFDNDWMREYPATNPVPASAADHAGPSGADADYP